MSDSYTPTHRRPVVPSFDEVGAVAARIREAFDHDRESFASDPGGWLSISGFDDVSDETAAAATTVVLLSWGIDPEAPRFRPVSYMATCSRCGETFVPADPADLIHLIREDGAECGGPADPESVGAWGVIR